MQARNNILYENKKKEEIAMKMLTVFWSFTGKFHLCSSLNIH